MDACQSLVVVVAIQSDMLRMRQAEVLHHLVDVVHAAAALAHRFCREVRVAAGPVPVGEELGLEADGEAEGLGNTVKQKA